MTAESMVLALALLGGTSLERGVTALNKSRFEEALTLLLSAENEGPYAHADYVRLHEQLGIVYAYIDRPEDAARAFDTLLTLDPGHVLPYTLSPKVTFLFERARKQSDRRAAPELDVSWPRGLEVERPVPITLEVVSDPKKLMKKAVLFRRLKGAARFEPPITVDLKGSGYEEVTLPPVAANATHDETLEFHVAVLDPRGNEIFKVADAASPREILLSYVPPPPWHRRWWVWAITATVAAGATGLVVYKILDRPPDLLSGPATWN
ncbi:MAG: hypothetical protein HY903_13120 [Deltaproteobacteria bacterium]|nr:hypothetical protein [Deltaproteobacteria bacterium]